jgi:hypothetical protein
MKTFSTIKNVALALGLLMFLGGCQGTQRTTAAGPLDNAGFMTAWDAYRHCQAGTDDVDAMRADMKELSRVASAQASTHELPIALPDFVKRVMTKPTSRLAADPSAMAAACALSTGQAAIRIERMDVAAEMFRTVLQNHPQPEYAYYVDQARVGMEEVARGVQAAAPAAAPTLIPISSTAFARRNSPPVSLED